MQASTTLPTVEEVSSIPSPVDPNHLPNHLVASLPWLVDADPSRYSISRKRSNAVAPISIRALRQLEEASTVGNSDNREDIIMSPPISPTNNSFPLSPTSSNLFSEQYTLSPNSRSPNSHNNGAHLKRLTMQFLKKQNVSFVEQERPAIVVDHDEEKFQKEREIARKKHASKEAVKRMNETLLTRQTVSESSAKANEGETVVTHPFISDIYQVLFDIESTIEANSMDIITRKHPSHIQLLNGLSTLLTSNMKKKLLGKSVIGIFEKCGDSEMKLLVEKFKSKKISGAKSQQKHTGTTPHLIEFLLDQRVFSVFMLTLLEMDAQDGVSHYLAKYYDPDHSLLLQPRFTNDLNTIFDRIHQLPFNFGYPTLSLRKSASKMNQGIAYLIHLAITNSYNKTRVSIRENAKAHLVPHLFELLSLDLKQSKQIAHCWRVVEDLSDAVSRDFYLSDKPVSVLSGVVTVNEIVNKTEQDEKVMTAKFVAFILYCIQHQVLHEFFSCLFTKAYGKEILSKYYMKESLLNEDDDFKKDIISELKKLKAVNDA